MFVLIHSPLVGTFTWSRVQGEMEKRGVAVIAPRLQDNGSAPFWKQQVESVTAELASLPLNTDLILVGHSGAGPLLPAIARYSPRRVSGYVFVDAGILWQGASRLELLAAENIEMAQEFESELRNGGKFPTWRAEDLRDILPDIETCEALAQDLQPRGLDFFQEELPAFSFPDAPSAYLQFSAAYDSYAREGQAREWRFMKIEAGHFHMLVNPVQVTDALLELTREMGAQQAL